MMARATGSVRTCTLHNARLSKVGKILYPYHPLFGKELEVFGGAGGQRDVIYVKLPNHGTGGVPAWMFDEVICSSVRAAQQPVIDCGALLRLAQLLDSLEASPRTGDDDNSRSQTKFTSATTGAGTGISGTESTHSGEPARQVRATVLPTAGARRATPTSQPRRRP